MVTVGKGLLGVVREVTLQLWSCESVGGDPLAVASATRVVLPVEIKFTNPQ